MGLAMYIYYDYIFLLPGSPEANIYIHYRTDTLIQLQSASMEKACYLVFEDGNFKAGQVIDKGSIFELVRPEESDGVGYVGLRPVTAEDCYLGFAHPESEPTCYPSTDLAATKFHIFL